MALIIPNKSTCIFCDQVLEEGTNYGGFPPFVPNPDDELFIFSDNAFHIDCLNAAENSKKAIAYVDESINSRRPGNRKCIVTGELITRQEDHIVIGYLTSDESSVLHQFNFVQIHRNNLAKWEDRPLLLSLLLALKASGNWQNQYAQRHLSALIKDLTL
jgi:hypothetical protein